MVEKSKPVLINRIQDRRGKTIFLPNFAECKGCDRFTENKKEEDFLKLILITSRVISEQTAYQMTSILKGVITRGTGKKLRDLNVPIAGKTGTTNNNFDAWFIGYNSNLVIGVYIGFDNPKTLGKYRARFKSCPSSF